MRKTSNRFIKYTLATDPNDARQKFKGGNTFDSFGEMTNLIHTTDLDLEKHGLKMYRLVKDRFCEVDDRGCKK